MFCRNEIECAVTSYGGIGWFVVHRLTAWRDRVNLNRKIRTDYLIKAYQNLANASQRPPQPEYFRLMESAIADIQLFGSKEHIQLVSLFLKEFSSANKASFDPLLNALRSDLRIDLDYEQLNGNVQWFRPEGAPDNT